MRRTKIHFCLVLIGLGVLLFLNLKQAAYAGYWISFEPSKADCVAAKRRTGKFSYELLVRVGHQGHDWTMWAAFTPANSPAVSEGTVVPKYQTITEETVVSLYNSGRLEKTAKVGNFQTSACGFPTDAEGNVSYDCWGIHDAFITRSKKDCR